LHTATVLTTYVSGAPPSITSSTDCGLYLIIPFADAQKYENDPPTRFDHVARLTSRSTTPDTPKLAILMK
jgi:hypothetical protein